MFRRALALHAGGSAMKQYSANQLNLIAQRTLPMLPKFQNPKSSSKTTISTTTMATTTGNRRMYTGHFGGVTRSVNITGVKDDVCSHSNWMSQQQHNGRLHGLVVHRVASGRLNTPFLSGQQQQQQTQLRSYDLNDRATALARSLRLNALILIMLINVAIFLIYQFFFASSMRGRQFFRRHMMASLSTLQNLHSLVLANFSHVDLRHLFFNMLTLYFIGNTMHSVLGSRKFVQVYLIAGVASVLTFLAEKFIRAQMATTARERMKQTMQACLGASGSISGLLTMFCLMFPSAQIQLYFILPIRAQYFLYGVILFEVMRLFYSPSSKISASGHLGGSAAGALMFALMKRGRF